MLNIAQQLIVGFYNPVFARVPTRQTWREMRGRKGGARSCYKKPHQGKRECERRVRQMKKAEARV